MSDKYQGKYRIASARLQNWDYGWNAMYFVTICTQNRECYFGDVVDGEMQLSPIGQIAQKYCLEIPQHFSFVELDEFVVMPNHVHAIIIINKMDDGRDGDLVETPNLGVSTKSTTTTTTNAASKKWKPGTLGVIINQYKRIVCINARKIHADFGWQSRYHDHIIRNDDSFQRIRNYICKNPKKWADDKFYE